MRSLTFLLCITISIARIPPYMHTYVPIANHAYSIVFLLPLHPDPVLPLPSLFVVPLLLQLLLWCPLLCSVFHFISFSAPATSRIGAYRLACRFPFPCPGYFEPWIWIAGVPAPAPTKRRTRTRTAATYAIPCRVQPKLPYDVLCEGMPRGVSTTHPAASQIGVPTSPRSLPSPLNPRSHRIYTSYSSNFSYAMPERTSVWK
ncbi:hypothetical protein FPV67DRAFT_534245 [Lyophyllum atratum]|nr:hypothetical protein FPV67DRAFT_534245 [Lyophyllum atratum]